MMRLLAVLLMLALLAGCSGKKNEKSSSETSPSAAQPFTPTGTDEEQVQQTVKRYNVLLADGYRTLNMNRLVEVTTQDQAEKAYIHMAAIGEGQVRMLSTLKKIDFTSLKREKPDTIVARTKEIWDFAYTDIKTGKETGKETDFIYEVTYTLKKNGPRWVIQDIVAYAPNDKEKPQPPRVIRPAERKTAPPVPAPTQKGAK